MVSRSAVTKVGALFIIDVIIVSVAAGVYFYLQNEGFIVDAPKSAEFTATGFTIDPLEVEMFEPTLIAINVTNVGDEPGFYIANLTINDMLEENQTTILLLSGESVMVEFTVIKEVEGNYTVELGGLSGSFNVKVPPPTSSKISLSSLVVSPYEAWANETITATVEATNLGAESDRLLVRLMVDGLLVDVKRIELAAGATSTVEFAFNSTSEGKHTVKVN
jgi:subtilase family serine protease